MKPVYPIERHYESRLLHRFASARHRLAQAPWRRRDFLAPALRRTRRFLGQLRSEANANSTSRVKRTSRLSFGLCRTHKFLPLFKPENRVQRASNSHAAEPDATLPLEPPMKYIV